ncbi:MAG: hypothetical protein FWC00_01615 [Firmicutes bacterium]|nr:hypothetical protein [Bacillota bacterium]
MSNRYHEENDRGRSAEQKSGHTIYVEPLPVTHELLVGKKVGDIMTLEEFDAFVGVCEDKEIGNGGSISLTTKENGRLMGHGKTTVQVREFENGFKIESMRVGTIS